MTGRLDELLHGEVAEQLLRSLLRDTTVQVRRNGATVPEWLAPVCEALQAAAACEPPPALNSLMSATGHAPGTVSRVGQELPIREAAEHVGRSERHVRRLCESGRVRASRIGNRVWLVDLESLQNVLGRAA